MEIIAPLSVHAEAATLAGSHYPRIIQIAFGNQHEATSQSCGKRFCFHRELLKKLDGRSVDKCVNRIDTQSVDMKIPHPDLRVVAEKPPNLVRARCLQVHGAAPRRFM